MQTKPQKPTDAQTHAPTHVAGGTPADLRSCCLCPRRCGVDRTAGERGFCRAGDRLEVFTYGPHHGEEPPISGTGGSGTIFFSRCTLRCLYCQNYHLSQEEEGTYYDVEGFAEILRALQRRRCHNWNLVSPTPWIPWITDAFDVVKRDGVSLPVVYNTSGFEDVSTLKRVSGYVDVYLADLRYASDDTAAGASGASNYVEASRSAFVEMWRQAGELEVDDDGVAVRGMICRLLVLPGHAEETIENLEWLRDTVGTGISIGLMSQYSPAYRAVGDKVWGRRVTREEYDSVCDAVKRMEFGRGWIQDHSSRVSEELFGVNLEPGRDPSRPLFGGRGDTE